MADEAYTIPSANAIFSYPLLKKMGYRIVDGDWIKRGEKIDQMETDEADVEFEPTVNVEGGENIEIGQEERK